jgi:hypothetical protein
LCCFVVDGQPPKAARPSLTDGAVGEVDTANPNSDVLRLDSCRVDAGLAPVCLYLCRACKTRPWRRHSGQRPCCIDQNFFANCPVAVIVWSPTVSSIRPSGPFCPSPSLRPALAATPEAPAPRPPPPQFPPVLPIGPP